MVDFSQGVIDRVSYLNELLRTVCTRTVTWKSSWRGLFGFCGRCALELTLQKLHKARNEARNEPPSRKLSTSLVTSLVFFSFTRLLVIRLVSNHKADNEPRYEVVSCLRGARDDRRKHEARNEARG